MTGLITNRNVSAALASALADHENQDGSFVMMSSRILLSTSTALIYLPPRVRAMIASVLMATSPPAAQLCKEPRTSSIGLTVAGSENPHGLAIELEINLGMGEQPGLLTDFGRDRHLALGSDPHRCSLLLHVRVTRAKHQPPPRIARCAQSRVFHSPQRPCTSQIRVP